MTKKKKVKGFFVCPSCQWVISSLERKYLIYRYCPNCTIEPLERFTPKITSPL